MSDTATNTTATPIRASDAERDQVVALLKDQTGAGRLSLAEFEERIAAAYVARSREQLGMLSADFADRRER